MADLSRLGQFETFLAMLVASRRDVGVLLVDGVTSGPGNQGTNCTANIQGHSGTPATFLGLARSIGGPGIGGASPT